jgi:hypothetical protein
MAAQQRVPASCQPTLNARKRVSKRSRSALAGCTIGALTIDSGRREAADTALAFVKRFT